jgi:hypothetical protein
MILHIQLIPRSPLKHEAPRTWAVGGERLTCTYTYIYIYMYIFRVYWVRLRSLHFLATGFAVCRHIHVQKEKAGTRFIRISRKKTNNRVTHTHTHTQKHFRLYYCRSIALARPCQKLGLAPRHGKKSTNIKADTLNRTTCLDISRPLTPASVVASQRYATTTSKRPPYASCFTGLQKQQT